MPPAPHGVGEATPASEISGWTTITMVSLEVVALGAEVAQINDVSLVVGLLGVVIELCGMRCLRRRLGRAVYACRRRT